MKKTFVQIGSNDGKTYDSFYNEWYPEQENWLGLFVEPEPGAFKKLIEAFADIDGMKFENSAICNERGIRKFYVCSRDTNDYDKISVLSSFDKNHIIKHNIDEKFIHEIQTNCITFNDLVQKHEIDHRDSLIIDTEGCDLLILESIDFNKILPQKIKYEHKHLSIKDKKRAIELLSPKYSLIEYTKENATFILDQ